MIALLQPARLWFDGRSRREQVLLAVMAAGLLGVLLWLGVARPAAAWRVDAAERRQDAAVDLALLRAAGGEGPTGEALETAARTEADAAGLNAVFAADAGGLAFSVSGAPGPVLFGWLAALKAGHGVETRTLAVSENADATLEAQGVLSGGQSAR